MPYSCKFLGHLNSLVEEGQVLSVETRLNSYAVIQLLKEPYVAVYKLFSVGNDWNEVELQGVPVLFIYGVTRQFLKNSRTYKLELKPAVIADYSYFWIKPTPESRVVTVFKGSPEEKTLILMGVAVILSKEIF